MPVATWGTSRAGADSAHKQAVRGLGERCRRDTPTLRRSSEKEQRDFSRRSLPCDAIQNVVASIGPEQWLSPTRPISCGFLTLSPPQVLRHSAPIEVRGRVPPLSPTKWSAGPGEATLSYPWLSRSSRRKKKTETLGATTKERWSGKHRRTHLMYI